MKRIPLPFLVFFLFAASLEAQTVFITPDEALKMAFPGATFTADKKTLSADQLVAAQKKLGKKLSKESWEFKIARLNGKIAGYALVDREIGKTEPIIFLTAITKTGEVKQVEILVYREAYGGEVHQKPFLSQYKGKKIDDSIRLGKDIKNITGATLSARAVSLGVKRALLLWTIFYGNH